MAAAAAKVLTWKPHCNVAGRVSRQTQEQGNSKPITARCNATAAPFTSSKSSLSAGFKLAIVVAPTRRHARQGKSGVRSALMPWTWDQQRSLDDPAYVVMWPTAFSEVVSAVHALKQGTTVILNLNGINGVDEQQRCVDFVAGGCHALDGHQEYLADCVFLFAPQEVKVAASYMRDASIEDLARP